MTYLQISDDGFLKAEQTQLEYFTEAMGAYEDALKEINSQLKDLYSKTLAGVKPEDYYNTAIKYDRLTKLKKNITDLYRKYSKLAGKYIKDGLIAGANEEYNRQLFVSSWSGLDITPAPINPKLLEFMCTGNVEVWKEIQKEAITKIYGTLGKYAPQAGTLTDLLSRNYADELNLILRTIESGLIRGASYDNISKSIKEIIGEVAIKADKLVGKGAKYKAMRIARTEGTRALNAANIAQMETLISQGIDPKKQWVATLDGRTRASHGALDGKQVDINESFPGGAMAPGQWGIASEDINCRCSMITVLPGFDPKLRRAVNPFSGETEVIDWASYSDWIIANGL